MKLKTFIIICILGMSLSSCETLNQDFPLIIFERSYDLQLTSNVDLHIMCGSVVDTTAGYGGIIVFRRSADGLPNDFICYDLACTSETCKYSSIINAGQNFGMLAICPVCNAQYDLLNYGWPLEPNTIDSKKSYPLYQYKTSFYGRYVVVENK